MSDDRIPHARIEPSDGRVRPDRTTHSDGTALPQPDVRQELHLSPHDRQRLPARCPAYEHLVVKLPGPAWSQVLQDIWVVQPLRGLLILSRYDERVYGRGGNLLTTSLEGRHLIGLWHGVDVILLEPGIVFYHHGKER